MTAALATVEALAASVEQVRRVIAPGAQATLDRLRGENLAEDGKLTLIGLGPIASQFGERWPARREAVYDHVERGLERYLAPDAVFLRVSDCDYLIAQPSVEPAAAQGFCLRFLRETLRHFLGSAREDDLALMQVRRIDDGAILAAPVDRASIARYAEGPLAAPATMAAPPAAPEALPPSNPWSPFVASTGRELHVSCYLQKAINLRTYDEFGYRIGRFVIATAKEGRLSPLQISALPRADIERIDKASIYQGLHLVRQLGQKPVTLSLPMSFTTLNSTRGRAMLFTACRDAAAMVTGGLIASLYDVEGVPPSTLLSNGSLLRPVCIRLLANLHAPSKSDIRGLRGGGLDGVGIHCPPFEGEAEFIGWIQAVVAEAKAVRGAVVLHGVSERQAAIAATLGVTHATLWQD